MATACIPQITFGFEPKGKPIVAAFDQPHASSDGGAVLLKSLDTQLQLTKRLAGCLVDTRQPGKVQHQALELVRQRVFGLACGYADCNAAAYRECDVKQHTCRPKPMELRQTAPGRYEATLPLDKYGSFLLRAEHLHEDKDGQLRQVAVSYGHVSNPYPREYASFEPDLGSMEKGALATGAGRFVLVRFARAQPIRRELHGGIPQGA